MENTEEVKPKKKRNGALRAIMKCILDGKQAAILVPTTVLAQQHYATACGRFKDFPVKIEVLSRFTTAKEQKRILEAARTGGLDLLIGTHKLLHMVPQGHFGYQPQAERQGRYLAIAAGSGITPMLAIIATTLQTEPESQFTLIYGNRTSQSMMFRQADSCGKWSNNGVILHHQSWLLRSNVDRGESDTPPAKAGAPQR